MQDRAEFARKGISRGRSVVAIGYDGGVLLVAENPSASLHKVSEIYDRVGFAAVGKYNEFEQLRVAGIRLADSKGYQYARADVTGRSLASAYANALGAAFTEGSKPFEVELLVTEVTDHAIELYHVLYDGSISDEQGFVAIGGSAELINERLAGAYAADASRAQALRTAVEALGGAEGRELEAPRLEVAGLERGVDRRRKVFRMDKAELTTSLEPA
jgi:proteasome alpha subunit